MKKMIGISIILFMTALIFTGCNGEKEMICHRTMVSGSDVVTATYNVWYKGEIVSKIKSVESLTSTNESTLEDYRSKMSTLYAPYLGIDYYNYNIDNTENQVSVTLDVDYEKVNVEELISIDSNNESFFHDGKVYLSTLLDLYENVGVVCDE